MVMGNYDDKMRKLFNHSESAFSLVINLLHFVKKSFTFTLPKPFIFPEKKI